MRLVSLAVGGLTLLGLTHVAQAVDPDPTVEQRCFLACQKPLVSLGVTFAGAPKGAAKQKCLNTLYVRSVFSCARMHCTDEEVDAGMEYTDDVCGSSWYNETTKKAVMALSSAQIANISQYGFLDDFKDARNTTIVPSLDMWELSHHSTEVYFDAKVTHLRYSLVLIYFWVGVTGIGILYRISGAIHKTITSRKRPILSAGEPTIWRKIRAHVLLPATFGGRCAEQMTIGTLPPRTETLTIVAYVALNVILCAVSYNVFPHNLYWDGESYQVWRYLCDRTGYLAYANLVAAWLFAMRNNVLAWLTGWEFATFNRFHRWIARTLVLEALIHAIGRTVYNIGWNGAQSYYVSFTQQNWVAGAVAIVAACLMLGLSIRYIRHTAYDFFLLAHIALALAVLVSLFFHTKRYGNQYAPWIFACVGFWAFDRVCRAGRILLSLALHGKGTIETTDLHDEANLIRIDIASSYFRGKYMQHGHVFLYSPFKLPFWQSHPFTLVRWKPSTAPTSPVSASPANTPISEAAGEKPLAAVTARSLTLPSPPTTAEYRYSLLLQPNKGYTHRLRCALQQHHHHHDGAPASAPRTLHFLVEGAYGSSPDLTRFSDVHLLVGGSGISVAISAIYRILEANTRGNAGGVRTAVRLCWAARSHALVQTVVERELAAALGAGGVEMEVYLTGAGGGEGDGKADFGEEMGLQVRTGRPDVAAVMREAIARRAGPVAFVVCGPAGLTDEVRRRFCQELSVQKVDMRLFVQSFAW